MFVSREAYREAIQRLLDHNEHQEDQIDRLVDLIQDVRNHLVRQFPECECHDLEDGRYECIQCRLRDAIKEATS